MVRQTGHNRASVNDLAGCRDKAKTNSKMIMGPHVNFGAIEGYVLFVIILTKSIIFTVGVAIFNIVCNLKFFLEYPYKDLRRR